MKLFKIVSKLFSVLIILLVCCFAGNVSATNYYLNSTSGNNSNNGKSINLAKKELTWFSWNTTFLKPGDTIFVMNGTYTGGTQFAILALRASGAAENPIVITNYPGHAPLLKLNDIQWAGIQIAEGVHDIVINGLRIQGNIGNLTLEDALAQPGSCSDPAGQVSPKFNGSGISIEGRTNGNHVHHITVSNCEIFECAGGGAGSMEADYLVYENNLIYNNCWYTIYGNSGISNLNSWNYDDHSSVEYSMIIRNNILYGNRLFVPWTGPCKIYDGNGIIIDSETNEGKSFPAYSGRTLIENNVVFDNGGRGIHVYKSANVDIINNTSYFNGKSPEISDGEITVQNASNIRVFNNIMVARDGERANLRYQSPTNITFGNNLIYNATSAKIGFTNETDIVGQNPEFMDPDLDNPDLRLKETSPARNAGTKEEGYFSEVDIDGISRFSGGIPDIGAYEFEEEIIKTTSAFSKKSILAVYPNPANQKINIRLDEDFSAQTFEYSLINLEGKTVLSGRFDSGAKSGDFTINIQNHKNGLYFLRLWNNKNTYSQKIMILK